MEQKLLPHKKELLNYPRELKANAQVCLFLLSLNFNPP